MPQSENAPRQRRQIAARYSGETRTKLQNACVDTLERRTLMSASLVNGLLTANGTAGNDDLRVDLGNGRLAVTLNGVNQGTFDPAAVTGIVLNGLDGDDQLRVGANVRGARLNGGNGNDFLTGGTGNDTLDGGAGNDVLDGKQGADVYTGGLGYDNADYRFETANLVLSLDGVANEQGGNAQGDNLGTDVERIIAGSGSDRITGSAADNSITGRDGNDTIFGLGGNDSIDGDAGNDSIDGGAGNDVLTGFGGADTMLGGDGTDSFIANDGTRDVLRGGAGADQAIADLVDDVAEIETGTGLPTAKTPEVTVTQGAAGINDGSSTVGFGTATQGAAAPTRVFTVKNDGAATLTLGAVQVPAGFTVVEGLASSLAPGASDTFTVRLDTGSTGGKSGQITFANNDANENPFNFAVTGQVNATTPPPAPKYPEVTVSLVQGTTATNVNDNATAAIVFGTVTRGQAAPTRTFRVKNDGQANLTLGAIALPAGYSVAEGLASTLAPGASDTFTIRLDTITAGTKSGQISFANNDSNENPFNFAIGGTVNNPVTPPPAPKHPEVVVTLGAQNVADNSTAAIGFGTVTRGAAAPTKVFTVKNTGQAALNLSGLRVPAGYTVVEGLSSSLAPGASDTFTVRLDTSVAGVKTGQVTVTTNDADENPFNFAIGGTVNNPVTPPPAPKYPEITVTMASNGMNVADGSTSAINFGAVTKGQAGPTRTFRVKNDGQATLTLGAVTLPAGFKLIDPLVGPLAPGAMESFTVQVDTSVAGTKSGQISIANNDPNEGPFNFAITATVNNPAPVTPPPPKVTAVMGGDGTLTVTGTPGNDSIVMTNDGTGIRITNNGAVVGASPFQRVKKIAVNAGEGNDLVYLTDLNVPAVLNGGGGSDTLRAGSGNDYANGNMGADVVEGYLGNDTLLGGPGDDLIIGGPGLDHLYGQDGNDTVQAADGLGDAMVDGGNGTDVIRKDRTDTASGT